MSPTMHDHSLEALIDATRFFFERGWVPATSGNFSLRLPDGTIMITVSGRHKGALDRDGLMAVDHDGQPLDPQRRPSAETLLHTRLYRRWPELGAVLHTHSPYATVLSRRLRSEDDASDDRPSLLHLDDYEVLKAFPGIDSHENAVQLPVFANTQDIPLLADRVDRYLDRHAAPPGYLIAGHGLYTWGATVGDARRHVEALEFLLQCETLTRRMTP